MCRASFLRVALLGHSPLLSEEGCSILSIALINVSGVNLFGALLKVVVGRVTREAGTSDPLFHDFLALLKTPGKQNPTALLFTSTYTQLYHLVWST
jgi:hypothetical protein